MNTYFKLTFASNEACAKSVLIVSFFSSFKSTIVSIGSSQRAAIELSLLIRWKNN